MEEWTRPSFVARAARLSILLTSFLRRMVMGPCGLPWASSRAFLTSSMPAPVFSRSSLIMEVVTVAMWLKTAWSSNLVGGDGGLLGAGAAGALLDDRLLLLDQALQVRGDGDLVEVDLAGGVDARRRGL